MEALAAYAADQSIGGKLRRRLVNLIERRPAHVKLERPMVSFTFDDAPASAVAVGGALLEAQGARGTYYVAAGLAGRDGPTGRYASREALMAAAGAGHDLACHTYSHLDCGAAGAETIAADVERNRETLAAWGAAPAVSFAYPYGDVCLAAKQLLAPRYALLRALHHGLIADGADLNQAPAVGIEGSDGEAVARRWLGRAAARKAWLVLYTHDVTESPSPWGCTPQALEGLISAARKADIDIVTVAEGLRRIAASV